MNLISGYPYSLIKNGLMYTYPALEQSIKTDVAIIGGGISGALMGYYLANAGIECVIIDGRTIGLGSTCASTSLLQYEIDVPLVDLKDKVGFNNAIRSYKLCEESIEKLYGICTKLKFNDFEYKKSLYYAAGKTHVTKLKKEFEIRKANGFDVEYLESDEIKNSYGFHAPGAIVSGVAAQADAYKLTHALHQYSQSKGVKVYDRTLIINIEHTENGVVVKTANDCTIIADKVIYATGYETVKYIDKKIVQLHTTYATATEQKNTSVHFWKEEALIWNTAQPYLYMRTTPDRRILIGGRDEKYITPAHASTMIAKKAKELCRDFNKLFPEIEANPEFNWMGIFGTTKDGLPFIGSYKKLPNSFFALGFGGNGITFSVIAAEIITAILKGQNEADVKLFSFER